jgi:hypothetical protein
MKVTVEVDCTPDEARQFFGLPDVKPLQAAVMARIEQQMMDGVKALSPEALLRAWAPFMPQNAEQMRDAFMALYRPFLGAAETGTSAGTAEKRKP